MKAVVSFYFTFYFFFMSNIMEDGKKEENGTEKKTRKREKACLVCTKRKFHRLDNGRLSLIMNMYDDERWKKVYNLCLYLFQSNLIELSPHCFQNDNAKI